MRALLLSMVIASAPAWGCGDKGDKPAPEEPRARSRAERRAEARSVLRQVIDLELAGELERAESGYRRALKLDPSYSTANLRYVHFLIDRGRTRDAVDVARRYSDRHPSDREALHALVDALLAAQDFREALSYLDDLVDHDRDDPVALEKRGRARVSAGDLSGVEDLERAAELAPDEPGFLTSWAAGLMRQGKTAEASARLKEALEADPRSARANLVYGILLRNGGKKKKAVIHLKRAVAADERDARAHYELGIALNLVGDNREAEDEFRRAVDLSADSATYWYALGDILKLRKKPAEAVSAYRAAAEIDPAQVVVRVKLAEMLFAIGENAEAEEVLLDLERDYPDDPDVLRALEDLGPK